MAKVGQRVDCDASDLEFNESAVKKATGNGSNAEAQSRDGMLRHRKQLSTNKPE